MRQGLKFVNNDDELLVDSNLHHSHFIGIATHVKSTPIDRVSQGSLYNGSVNFRPGQDLSFLHEFKIESTNSDRPPLCFVKPTFTGSSAPFCSVVLAIYNTTESKWEITVLEDFYNNRGEQRPSLYCFNTFPNMSDGQKSLVGKGNYGIVCYNEKEDKTFDSRFYPLKIIDTVEVSAPQNAVITSSLPNFVRSNPTNKAITVPSDIDVNSLMFYCPSLCHACYQGSVKDSGDTRWGSGDLEWEVWEEQQIWWTFYRNSFRFLDKNTVQGSFTTLFAGTAARVPKENSKSSSTVF